MQAGDESVHTVNAAAVVLAAAARSSTGLQRNHHQHLQLYDHAPAGTVRPPNSVPAFDLLSQRRFII
jgi:hypothetical protein